MYFVSLALADARPFSRNPFLKKTHTPPQGSLAMCVLIKDLRRSGVHVCANKGLSRKLTSPAPATAGPGVFRREATFRWAGQCS
jgi:hypothetical protein